MLLSWSAHCLREDEQIVWVALRLSLVSTLLVTLDSTSYTY